MLPVRTRVELDQCQVPGEDGNSTDSPRGDGSFVHQMAQFVGARQTPCHAFGLAADGGGGHGFGAVEQQGRPSQVLPFQCVPSTQRAQATLERLSITRVPSSEGCMPTGAVAADAAAAGSWASTADAAEPGREAGHRESGSFGQFSWRSFEAGQPPRSRW